MRDSDLAAITQAPRDNDLARAEALARARLSVHPEDAEALTVLAHVAATTGFVADAERLLRAAIAVAPGFIKAHADLASLLCRLERADEAIALLDAAGARAAGAIWPLSLKAAVLDAERRTEEALTLHQELVGRAGHASIPWLNHGHALRAVGRVDEAVAAYRMSLRRDPANGHAWWGLASLRPAGIGPEDIALMERALSSAGEPLRRVHLHFALGRALGDRGRFERSFRHLETGNRLRGTLAPYDPGATRDLVRRVGARFDAEFLARRAGWGADAPDPIFIVGMPRSGSTLVEQILASHPMVEGGGELFELRNLAVGLAGRDVPPDAWPELVADMDASEPRALGERYLASTRRHRRTDRPFFTDKMPSNWRYIGLIRLILPNARIIDVRREPMACCLSAFATYFNQETSFPTALEELGRYYADYVDMLAHFDEVLPGAIHRVRYESLVADLEGEVGRLLDHLGLPFDEACLRFHENPRAVHTPSAPQVRVPINGKGLDFWRNYEPWLGPLRKGLGARAGASDAPAFSHGRARGA